MRIAITASPFHLGPSGAALHVAHELLRRGDQPTLMVRDAHPTIAEGSGVPITLTPADGALYAADLVKFVKGADAHLSLMDRDGFRVALHFGIPSVWLELLAWWKEIQHPHWISKGAALLAASSIETAEERARFFPGHADWVGPVVPPSSDPNPRLEARRGIVVVLGGVDESRFGLQDRLSILAHALRQRELRDAPISIVGPQDVAVLLSRQLSDRQHIAYGTLPQQRLLDLMANSTIMVATPGLSAPMEAWAVGTPVVFSGPLSLSQDLQLRRFVNSNAIDSGPDGASAFDSGRYWNSLKERVRAAYTDAGVWQHHRRRGYRFLSDHGNSGIGSIADTLEVVAANHSRGWG